MNRMSGDLRRTLRILRHGLFPVYLVADDEILISPVMFG